MGGGVVGGGGVERVEGKGGVHSMPRYTPGDEEPVGRNSNCSI